MEVYTIGFTQRSAQSFFGELRRNGIKRLVDVRLNNSSQLAGFTKKDDLRFFLNELCDAEYIHEPLLAPTAEIMDTFKKKGGRWEDFERRFLALMTERQVDDRVDQRLFAVPTVLLCSEAAATHCHRRLVAEYLRQKWGDLQIIHL